MSLQWTFVAGFLYGEIFICFLLCLPFIGPKRWHYLFKSRIFSLFVSYGNLYFMVLISVLVILFADAIREVRKYSLPDAQQVNLTNNPNTQDHVLMMLFRAQRNLYISGFALFLWLVLRRLVILISNTALLEANCEASKRQAESASRTAQELLNQGDKKENAGDGEDETKNLKSEIKELKSKLSVAEKEAESAQTDLQAMKTQAKATSREYDRLAEEMAKLQNERNEGDKKDE